MQMIMSSRTPPICNVLAREQGAVADVPDDHEQSTRYLPLGRVAG
jgi:hypothetical protein